MKTIEFDSMRKIFISFDHSKNLITNIMNHIKYLNLSKKCFIKYVFRFCCSTFMTFFMYFY